MNRDEFNKSHKHIADCPPPVEYAGSSQWTDEAPPPDEAIQKAIAAFYLFCGLVRQGKSNLYIDSEHDVVYIRWELGGYVCYHGFLIADIEASRYDLVAHQVIDLAERINNEIERDTLKGGG